MIAAWPSAAGEEYAVAFDKGRPNRVLVLPAWFDESNKLRRFTVAVMRRLDGSGIDSFLPDLPGCNESLAPLAAQSLASWREAAAEAATHFAATHVLAFRAAALIAPDALPGWRYAPVAAGSQLRSLLRARALASREAGREENRDDLLAEGRSRGLDLAGYRLGPELFAALADAELPAGQLRDIAQGDIGGPGLWLRAEPDHDPKQADALAAIVAMELLSEGSVRGELVEPRSAPTPVLRQAQDERGVKRKRRHFTFDCAGSALAATLDHASGTTGLLIVTGGTETRAGAFSSQAQLAASVAAAGHPVLRFDRRGVGDSEGVNRGFRHSGEDIAAAVAAFRAQCPALARVVAFGNCNAASALMLAGGADLDGLVLSNPWTYEDEQAHAPPPPAAIRARYAAKLKNPREVLRLLGGKVSLAKLARGLAGALSKPAAPSGLAESMKAGLAGFSGPVRILIAERDRTGQAFLAAWDERDPRLARCPGADHAYSDDTSREWLLAQILATLADE